MRSRLIRSCNWQNRNHRPPRRSSSPKCRGRRKNDMKSAYELAMERLNKSSPTIKLTEKQKKEIAELDSKYQAKVAEREIGLKGEISKAAAQGDYEAMEKLEQQLAAERRKLQSELEEKKEQVRQRTK